MEAHIIRYVFWKEMMKILMLLIRRARLALLQVGPYMALLMLPGGYVVALSTWVYRHSPVVNGSTDMADKRNARPESPVANYSPAIARAVEWLGDRYLLAKPIHGHSMHTRSPRSARTIERSEALDSITCSQ
jgi:hypothetical protein